MEREIKFRGKIAENGQWVYGYLYQSKTKSWITDSVNIDLSTHRNFTWWQVIPETVGQFNGLTDKNGKDAYAGDFYDDGERGIWLLKQDNIGVWAEMINSESWVHDFTPEIWEKDCEIIGNIHENPELIK